MARTGTDKALEATAETTPETTPETTIEQLKVEPATLADRIRSDERAKREDAAERYRELLRRNGRPASGDTEALKEVMSILDRSLRDLDDDLELVAVLDAMDAAGRAQEELKPQLHAAVMRRNETYAAYAAERDEVQERHAELMRQADAGHARVSALVHAAARTIAQPGRHRARWAEIVEGRVDRGRARRGN